MCDDEVGVVPPRRSQEHIGVLDPGLDERVDLERGADREAAAGVLPARGLIFVQTLVRERIAVQHRYVVARLKGAFGHRRAHSARAHDQDQHAPHCRAHTGFCAV